MITQDDIDAFKEEEMSEERLRLLCSVNDLTIQGPLGPLPALTVLLFRVCDNNMQKFDLACRLINLFIDEAEKPKP